MVDPVQSITFLGIEIDSMSMTKRLPQDKLLSLKQELQAFTRRCRASKKQLLSLAGKLSWAARVVYGGRVFIRRIIDSRKQLQSVAGKLSWAARVVYGGRVFIRRIIDSR